MTTIDVPPVTVPPGSESFSGPVDDDSNDITITIDRTPDGGLDSLTADSSVSVGVTASYDGGDTFGDVGFGGPWPGGTELGKHGVPRTADTLMTELDPGTGRIVQLTVTVGGPADVVVAGSIVTS